MHDLGIVALHTDLSVENGSYWHTAAPNSRDFVCRDVHADPVPQTRIPRSYAPHGCLLRFRRLYVHRVQHNFPLSAPNRGIRSLCCQMMLHNFYFSKEYAASSQPIAIFMTFFSFSDTDKNPQTTINPVFQNPITVAVRMMQQEICPCVEDSSGALSPDGRHAAG